ncbi:MAG: cytochrome c biogenesis protein CcsA [Candidatus Accumulibacter sp.]|uniref:cytochrome c biogenesis protein CcsA n=1 Tax=Accumulibacter sp. TaxID=2053492 RepID=UPI002878987D|nr:cytochrome c biogenesis protein CcsA [Accumulibacter sp.]MDS4015284.1 cytochrome c biogenesis protein CcsA [Accumulibacter sp.]
MNELRVLWGAVVAYVLAGSLAILGVMLKKRPDRYVLALMVVGLLVHTASIAMRWERLGHGPFVSMFEILTSNVWSLMLVFSIAYWRLPVVRPMAAVVMPILFIMMGWLMTVSPGETRLPPTYHTVWLFVHIGFAKVFMGAMLVAVGLSGIILSRATRFGSETFHRLPDNDRLSDLGFRWVAVGFVFHTLMLIAGAIWAQDAWGRYWDWDPLETWSFITWLMVAISLHARITFRISPRVGAWMTIAVFVTAFLTFFGIPFVTQSAHQGAV